MKEKIISITTPEKIRFTYQISELGTRIAAYCIDMIIQLAIILAFSIIAFFSACGSILVGNLDAGYLASMFIMLMLFFLQWFYYVLFETLLDGRSPGKKLLKIKVIKTNGEPLDFQTIVIRNFIRIVDSFPIFHFIQVILIGTYLIGGCVSLIDKKGRRLGDIIGKTVVVNEIKYNLEEPLFSVKISKTETSTKKLTLRKKLNEDELYIIRRFLNDRTKLPAQKEKEIALNLARQVAEKLQIDCDEKSPILFLEHIYKEHSSEN